MPSRLVCLIAAAGLLAGSACGDDGEESDRGAARSTTTSIESPKGPGTPFGTGFEVVEGSALLGRVFVHSVNGRRLSTAVLTVDGDPIEVWNAYMAQARAVGITPVGGTFGPCGLRGLTGEDRTYNGPIDEPVPAGTVADLDCSALAVLRPASSQDPGATQGMMSFSLRRSGPGSEPPVSHLLIETDDGAAPVPPSGAPADQRTSWSEPFPAPTTGDLPGAGAAIIHSTERYVVEEGSALIGPPGHNQCNPDGFTAVLSVRGDVNAVVPRSQRQFERHGLSEGTLTTQRVAGEEVLAGSLGAAGGGYVVVVAVTSRTGEGHLLLSRCSE